MATVYGSTASETRYGANLGGVVLTYSGGDEVTGRDSIDHADGAEDDRGDLVNGHTGPDTRQWRNGIDRLPLRLLLAATCPQDLCAPQRKSLATNLWPSSSVRNMNINLHVSKIANNSGSFLALFQTFICFFFHFHPAIILETISAPHRKILPIYHNKLLKADTAAPNLQLIV